MLWLHEYNLKITYSGYCDNSVFNWSSKVCFSSLLHFGEGECTDLTRRIDLSVGRWNPCVTIGCFADFVRHHRPANKLDVEGRHWRFWRFFRRFFKENVFEPITSFNLWEKKEKSLYRRFKLICLSWLHRNLLKEVSCVFVKGMKTCLTSRVETQTSRKHSWPALSYIRREKQSRTETKLRLRNRWLLQKNLHFFLDFLIIKTSSNQTFGCIKCVGGISDSLSLCGHSNQSFALWKWRKISDK